jgi:hypothetical protein
VAVRGRTGADRVGVVARATHAAAGGEQEPRNQHRQNTARRDMPRTIGRFCLHGGPSNGSGSVGRDSPDRGRAALIPRHG